METKRQRADYTPLIERAKQNIEHPKALAWLAAHGIAESSAKAMDLGYIDAEEHPELTELLETIQATSGTAPGHFGGSWIIVPHGTGYFIGINADPAQEATIMGRYYRPPVGIPSPWNSTDICTSEGAPVLITSGLEDAIAFREAGASVVCFMTNLSDGLASLVRSRTASGPLVFMSGTAEDVKNARGVIEVLASKGVAALAYQFTGEGEADYNGAMNTWRADPEKLRRMVRNISDWSAKQAERISSDYLQSSMAVYVDQFRQIIASRTDDQAIGTGLEGLDEMLDGGLYPGLYVMGAMSSLGKTTMALQIADHIAATGQDVLFFTLEQSREELMAKSISRITAQYHGDGSTSRYILFKAYKWMATPEGDRIGEAIDRYASHIAPCMYFIEDDEDRGGPLQEGQEEARYSDDYRIGLDTIRRHVKRHIQATGRHPVVFVDYLQILRPEDETGKKTDKQNLDGTISELRRLSKAQHIPVFAISSFNRDHYDQGVSFGSFNGTSSIEYSADVLLGLQPRVIADPNKKGKGQPIDDGQELDVRDVTLRVLKNRIGAKGSVPLMFNARYGLFMEDDQKELQDEDLAKKWDKFQ